VTKELPLELGIRELVALGIRDKDTAAQLCSLGACLLAVSPCTALAGDTAKLHLCVRLWVPASQAAQGDCRGACTPD
jgi:hypothetical protein